MLHAIIMAGGAGTRFWPESRTLRPKQLLDFAGGRTMIQATVDRLGSLAPPQRVVIVTNQQIVAAIAEQLPQLPPESILCEPCKRDTAPCIGLAAFHVIGSDPKATMAVMPSDHVISPDEAFQQALVQAAALVEERPERIVTFGIRPSYAAESFGYIERGEQLHEGDLRLAVSAGSGDPRRAGSGDPRRAPVYRVNRFREKPKGELARQYFESGQFYWNSGIFVWKATTILAALRERQPEMYGHLEQIVAAAATPRYQEVLQREFTAIRGISIDYAVMEAAPEVLVIEAPFAWDDVGSWQALARLRGSDENGNTILARHAGLNTSGSIIRAGGEHLIATLGVKDCIIVHTPDATLVANKHDEEAVRQLVRMLEERGWKQWL
jgi:mannose-1-phosphate guanylyltransferase